ncbi:AIPR family protein [Streptomyces bacillaris]|uniref:AIPR family protein n=1 Tax=Streptomyces TaxID=1883 RepID=UPI000A092C96|nr:MULTISPECIES: AIPR family protein [unclassified Streptomyces]ARI53794.1 abortive phage resistance protein [Streptomyces sp. S8]NGO82332.1 abortive phage resistance protein [Streptomyces sp. 196(2019)]
MAELELTEFSRSLVADVQATADAEGTTTPETFTRRVFEDLEQAGVVSNTFTAFHKAHGHEVHGYGIGESGESLDLFVTDFQLTPLDTKLTKGQTETCFRRLLTFAVRCRDGLQQHIDESFDVYDMCAAVEKALTEVQRIRLFLLSNRVATFTEVPASDLDGLPVTHEVWDLARLHRHATSGALGEPIVVPFSPPLPCVSAPSSEEDHSVVLAVIPGQMLGELYAEYDTRLLELNVRSFLQTRGAVNRGIRETLLHAPGRFLAYNNGITATASQVDFVRGPDGVPTHISGVHGLQIVNGGQTTASLHHTLTRDKADLSEVRVQMKLTEVAPDRLAEIVPKISEYSNTQNRVTQVDFSSNHEYHVEIQRITRSLWAPATDGSSQETHWFYERARGQYTDALAKARTPARQRQFKKLNPAKRKFTKADLAKYVHSWHRLPHLVSRGAQKNFVEFMLRVEEAPPRVDLQYCQRVIGMAILFKAVDRIAAIHGAGSHKSMITTYTVARLSLATDRRIDLDRIWREQSLSPVLESAVHDLCPRVMRAVTAPLAGNHVGEWAKKVACWDAVSEVPWTVPRALSSELLDQPLDETALAGGTGDETGAGEEAAQFLADEWYAIEDWAKETRVLEPWQRQLAHFVGKRLELGEEVPEAQAVQALHTRTEALRLGFTPAP